LIQNAQHAVVVSGVSASDTSTRVACGTVSYEQASNGDGREFPLWVAIVPACMLAVVGLVSLYWGMDNAKKANAAAEERIAMITISKDDDGNEKIDMPTMGKDPAAGDKTVNI